MAHPRKADVLVADTEPVARCGLVRLLNSHPKLRVCAEAETLAAARELCARHRPAVLVLDPAMGEGFTFIKDLPKWSRGTRVVVFTGQHDALAVQRAFKAGACGFVTRRDPIAALLTAVVGALTGERHVGPQVEHLLLENLATGTVELRGDEMAVLSDRELQVFRLLGSGLGTRAVATELHVSVKTVETHRQRMKEKLQVATSTELHRRAVLFHGRK
jgi:DNA-binding NarL/FixJ family response regulator